MRNKTSLGVLIVIVLFAVAAAVVFSVLPSEVAAGQDPRLQSGVRFELLHLEKIRGENVIGRRWDESSIADVGLFAIIKDRVSGNCFLAVKFDDRERGRAGRR